MDIGSILIGIAIGIFLQRFFNVTKRIADGIKQYQTNQKKLKQKKKEAEQVEVKQYD